MAGAVRLETGRREPETGPLDGRALGQGGGEGNQRQIIGKLRRSEVPNRRKPGKAYSLVSD